MGEGGARPQFFGASPSGKQSENSINPYFTNSSHIQFTSTNAKCLACRCFCCCSYSSTTMMTIPMSPVIKPLSCHRLCPRSHTICHSPHQCPGRKFLGIYIYVVAGQDPSDSKSNRIHVRHLPVLMLSFIRGISYKQIPLKRSVVNFLTS